MLTSIGGVKLPPYATARFRLTYPLAPRDNFLTAKVKLLWEKQRRKSCLMRVKKKTGIVSPLGEDMRNFVDLPEIVLRNSRQN